MAEVPVDVQIYFPERMVRFKAYLDGVEGEPDLRSGMAKLPGFGPQRLFLTGRLANWKETPDGRPATSPAPADRTRGLPARVTDRSSRSRRRARARARKRAAA
jgi:hypothetical protein